MASQPIRVAIYPQIPDLAGDELAGLKQFIADEFKKVSGESIEVDTDVDPYDLEKLKSTYLTDDRNAYDVMEVEVDTEFLKKLVETGCLQALEDHFTVTEDVFTPTAFHSVRYRHSVYGVPTLICAKFVMELADVDHGDWASFDQLKEALGQGGSGHSLLLKSDFVCTDTDEVLAESKLILIYAYSEHMGEALQRAAEKNKHKKTLRIVSPPIDNSNKLLTYTDAVVVNKLKFADPKRAAVITKFVKFYTSLSFRTSFAFGKDLPSSIVYPRYVLPARKDFYTKTAVQDNYYQQFYDALQHSVPAPNDDLRRKGKALEEQLKKARGVTPTE